MDLLREQGNRVQPAAKDSIQVGPKWDLQFVIECNRANAGTKTASVITIQRHYELNPWQIDMGLALLVATGQHDQNGLI